MKEIKIENSNRFALVDDKNFERISKYKWFDNNSGRLCRQYCVRFRCIRISLANEIMQDYDSMYDHKDRDSYNNLESNLRRCTYQQNNFNKGKRVGLTSKYKGVCWCSVLKKWVARISKDRKTYHLGYFDDEILAAKAYDIKAIELFGEFAYLNFPLSTNLALA